MLFRSHRKSAGKTRVVHWETEEQKLLQETDDNNEDENSEEVKSLPEEPPDAARSAHPAKATRTSFDNLIQYLCSVQGVEQVQIQVLSAEPSNYVLKVTLEK